jgi:hypothetical protein
MGRAQRGEEGTEKNIFYHRDTEDTEFQKKFNISDGESESVREPTDSEAPKI